MCRGEVGCGGGRDWMAWNHPNISPCIYMHSSGNVVDIYRERERDMLFRTIHFDG